MKDLFEIGELVRISDERCILKDEIFAWYKVKDDIKAHLFKEKVLYGIYLGDPFESSGVFWYKVLINNRFFLFSENQLNQLSAVDYKDDRQ